MAPSWRMSFFCRNVKQSGSPKTVEIKTVSFWRRPPTLWKYVSNVAPERHSIFLIWEMLPLWRDWLCCRKWVENGQKDVGKLEVDPFSSELRHYVDISRMLPRGGIQDCWFEECSRCEGSDFVVGNRKKAVRRKQWKVESGSFWWRPPTLREGVSNVAPNGMLCLWFEESSRYETGYVVARNVKKSGSPKTLAGGKWILLVAISTLREHFSNVAPKQHSRLLIWEMFPLWRGWLCCRK